MSSDPFYGEIMPWPINYAPKGWAFCDGSLLPIAQYQALYALIGTTYGGNGVTSFALPDLRGRVPLGAGQSPSSSIMFDLGEQGGAETATFTQTPLPALTGDPVQSVLSLPQGQTTVSIMPPYLAINYVIALTGWWPSRP